MTAERIRRGPAEPAPGGQVGARAFEVADGFQVNTVVWLSSLPDAERGPSRRMSEDLSALASRHGYVFEESPVRTRDGLLEALAEAAGRAGGAGLRPFFHFDCHGSAEQGLLLAPNGDRVAWSGLADGLRAVNVAARNDVCRLFGACCGFHLSTAPVLSRPAPYFLTIAPEREVTVGVLERRTAPFYARFFETGDVTRASRGILHPDLSVLMCTAVFAEALATYLADHARGRAGRELRERLAALLLRRRGILEPTRTTCGTPGSARNARSGRRPSSTASLRTSWSVDVPVSAPRRWSGSRRVSSAVAGRRSRAPAGPAARFRADVGASAAPARRHAVRRPARALSSAISIGPGENPPSLPLAVKLRR